MKKKKKDKSLGARQRYSREEVLKAAREITGKDLRGLDEGVYEIPPEYNQEDNT